MVRRVINIIPSLTKDHLLKFNLFLAVSICFIGVYSPIIKEQFGLKQGTIQFVGTVGNIGAWFLIPAGYSFDAYGPRPGIVIGVILCCVGYLVLWGVISNRISYSTALLAFAAFTAQHGCGWWDGTAVPLASRNFPQDRGVIVGLIKGFFGISSSVVTVLYQSFFRPDISGFMLTLAIGLPAGALASILGAKVSHKKGDCLTLSLEEKAKVVAVGYGLLATLVVYISVSSLYQKVDRIPALGYILLGLLSCFGALYFPVEVKWMEEKLAAKYSKDGQSRASVSNPLLHASDTKPVVTHSRETNPLALSGSEDEAKVAVSSASRHHERRWSEATASYGFVMRQEIFWLVFLVCFVGIGGGITLINNIGDLNVSLSGTKGTKDVYVVLISVGSCVGRAGAGLLSDTVRTWSRSTYLLANTILMMVAQVTLCIASLDTLYLSCFLVGVGFGGYFSLMPILLGDFYAGKDFGKILGTAMMAPALGSLIFSTVIASSFYSSATKNGELICKGQRCFNKTWGLLAGCCFLACLLCVRLKSLSKSNN